MQTSINSEPLATPAIAMDEEIDLLELIRPLLQRKARIALITALSCLAGYLVSLLFKPVFTATAVIMPPQQAQSAASVLAGQLGGLGSLGGASALGLKNPGDLYVGILESRLIADRLIDQFHLQEVYHAKLRTDARATLHGRTEFEAAKNGLIYVHVKDHDSQRAAALANGYIDALHQTNSRLAIGEAAQRRLFFDQQLADERKALATAEDALKATQERTGMIQLSGQAEVTIRSIANARAEIASRQVQLGVLRTFATDQNPDVERLQQEIASLKGQLASLETSQQRTVPGDLQISGGQMPSSSLDYLRKLREVRYHESLFELLAKQQEAASLDESKSAPSIQVVDPAEAPEKRSGPQRLYISLGAALAGLLASSVWVLVHSRRNAMHTTSEPAVRLTNRTLPEAMQHPQPVSR